MTDASNQASTRTITALYFAAVRDLAGIGEETLELPAEVRTIAQLRAHLEMLHPPLAQRLGRVRFSINERFAQGDAEIEHGDEVALIPPVAGG